MHGNAATYMAVCNIATKTQSSLYNKVSGAMFVGLEPAGTTRVLVYWAARNDSDHIALQDFLRAIQAEGTPHAHQ